MTTTLSGVVVFDPTCEPAPERATRAERPGSLEGLRVGFLDNSKRNSDKVLQFLDELLRERYGIAGSIHRRKPGASRVIAPDQLEELAGEVDVVVPGVGD